MSHAAVVAIAVTHTNTYQASANSVGVDGATHPSAAHILSNVLNWSTILSAAVQGRSAIARRVSKVQDHVGDGVEIEAVESRPKLDPPSPDGTAALEGKEAGSPKSLATRQSRLSRLRPSLS
jgi:hypothetical protein